MGSSVLGTAAQGARTLQALALCWIQLEQRCGRTDPCRGRRGGILEHPPDTAPVDNEPFSTRTSATRWATDRRQLSARPPESNHGDLVKTKLHAPLGGRIAAAAILMVCASACGGPACAAGGTQPCVCPPDVSGAQRCADDGSRWLPCECAAGGASAGPTPAASSVASPPTSAAPVVAPAAAPSPADVPAALLAPARTVASRFLREGHSSYPASNAFDGTNDTAWSVRDAVAGSDYLEACFSGRPTLVRVELTTGFERIHPTTGDLFEANAHLRGGRILVDGVERAGISVTSDQRSATIELPAVTVGECLRIEVGAVWPGVRWQDLAISEVRIYGTPDASAATAPPDTDRCRDVVVGDWSVEEAPCRRQACRELLRDSPDIDAPSLGMEVSLSCTRVDTSSPEE